MDEFNMPQPLLSYTRLIMTKGINLVPGAEVLERKPEFAALIGQVIAWSSELELSVAIAVVHILGDHAGSGISMYLALVGGSAQNATVRAAAAHNLSPADNQVFESILNVVEAVSKRRNKVAHHLWAEWPDMPDAIVLQDPEQTIIANAGNLRDLDGPKEFTAQDRTIWHQFGELRDMVYKEKDFKILIRDIKRAIILVKNFTGAIVPDNPHRDEARRWLLSAPEVVEALLRQRKSQKSFRSKPQK
jgi:hypothetical protein